MQSLSKRSITYNFDLSNDDEFHRNLTDFFIDNFKTKDLKLHDVHCWFPCTFTCNKYGDIVNIQIDTVGEKNLDYQFLNQDLRNSVLKTLKSLKKFKTRKEMKKDSVIRHSFYIYIPD